MPDPVPLTMGSLEVYARPAGDLLLDGVQLEVQAPTTLSVPTGPHRVQVLFDGTLRSDIKDVEVTTNTTTKVSFIYDEFPIKDDLPLP